MKHPTFTPEELKLNADITKAFEKSFGRSLTSLEIYILSVLKRHLSDSITYLNKKINQSSILEDSIDLITTLEGTILDPISEGDHPCFNASLLELIGKGNQPLQQQLSCSVKKEINTKLNDDFRLLSKIKNSMGIPTRLNSISFDSKIDSSIYISQYTFALRNNENPHYKIEGKEHLLSFIGIPDKCSKILATDPHQSLEFEAEEVPQILQQLILFTFLQELFQSQNSQIVYPTYAQGILPVVHTICIDNNCGINFHYKKKECQNSSYTIPIHFIPGLDNGLLVLCKKDNIENIKTLVKKWNLVFSSIGNTIDENSLIVSVNGKENAYIPLDSIKLIESNIVQEKTKKSKTTKDKISLDEIEEPIDLAKAAKELMSRPNLLSKDFITQKFDYMSGLRHVTTNTEACLMKIPSSQQLLNTVIDQMEITNDIEVQLHLLILRSMQKVICSGGSPKQLNLLVHRTDIKDIADKITDDIKGHFSIDQASINIDLSNDKRTKDYVSLGITGILSSRDAVCSYDFKNKGDMIYIIGNPLNDIAASEYLSYIKGKDYPLTPYFDYEFSLSLTKTLYTLVQNKLLQSAHTISKGGLFAALVESSMTNLLGFDITCPAEVRTDGFLFGESPLTALVSVNDRNETGFIDLLMESNIPFNTLGHVTREELRVDDISCGFIIDYKKRYENILKQQFTQ